MISGDFTRKISKVATKAKLSDKETMKAICYEGTGYLKLLEVPKPLITNTEDAIIRVTCTTICGSDLHLYNGEVPELKPGDILGHEFMGIVEEVGPEVHQIKKGMRVVSAFVIACGRCEYCKRGEFSGCPNANDSISEPKSFGNLTAGFFGYSHLTGGHAGGQAEYVRVPFADTTLLPIPQSIPNEKALLLSDIIPTAWHANELAHVNHGDRVAIWGAGPVGLLAAKWAYFRGAYLVAIIDGVDYRLKLAKKWMPEIVTLNYKTLNVVDELKLIMCDGPDVGLDCVGCSSTNTLVHKAEKTLGIETDSPEVINEMALAVRPFGRLGIVGAYVGFANHVNIGALMEKGFKIGLGQCPVQKYWAELLKKIECDQFDPTFVYTHKGSIEDIPKLYHMFNNKEDGIVKAFVTTTVE